MLIIPSLFIQNGKVISLYKGSDNESKRVYPKAPQSYAELFYRQGARILFVVDLDGDQRERLIELKQAFPGKIWWAGKLRELERLRWLFEHGVDRVVLGQSAQPIHQAALAEHGADRVMVGLKLRLADEITEHCEALSQTGFTDIIVKDLNAEGTLFQPNFDIMEKCVYFSSLKVYASGGISQAQHLQLLEESGVTGALIGRALYENELSLSNLL